MEGSRMIASKEGILTGITSGAAMAAVLEIAKGKGRKTQVLVMLPDTGERYLSTGLFT